MRIHETGPRLWRAERRDGNGAIDGRIGGPSRLDAVSMSGADHDGGSPALRRPNTVKTVKAHDTPETPEARADRTKEIKFRILEGAYDSLEAVDELARRILASGDM